MTDSPRPARPLGRRPGDAGQTKAAILAAARQHFGAVGFDRATIRAIAETAEVDPASVMHHFSNKQQLFVQAHALPVDPAMVAATVGDLPVAQRGDALAHAFLAALANPGAAPLSIVRAAATNDDAARLLREFIEGVLVDHAAHLAEGPNPELRMALIGSHLVGLLFAREIVGLGPLTACDTDALAQAIGPVLQHYINPPRATSG